MTKEPIVISAALIERYMDWLREQERSDATISKYRHSLTQLCGWLGERPADKDALIEWKRRIAAERAPASVNSMLAALNGLLTFAGRRELTVKRLRLQRSLFLDESRELSSAEYARLVKAAEGAGNRRLSLVLQTICATGIRVSELRFITAEAVRIGRAEISNKGKRRIVFLPGRLCRLLKGYLQKENKASGPVFTTRNGKPLDRSNIWRAMKSLCEAAGVEPGKVFPHNLRHLFARTYYTLERDLSRLADILGHSSVNTTRIYTAESGAVHARQLERMGLIVT